MKNTENVGIDSYSGLQNISSLRLFLRQHQELYADVSVEIQQRQEVTDNYIII